MADGKYFVIRSQLNDLVLDVKDGACGDGQEVTTWSHHGGDNQLWLEDDVAGVIRSKMDESYVLHMTGDVNRGSSRVTRSSQIPKPFDNEPRHSTCCHLAIGSGTKILPISTAAEMCLRDHNSNNCTRSGNVCCCT